MSLFAALAPTLLKTLQNDSNRGAQAEQQRINTLYSPWIKNNSQAHQTNDGDVLSQGLASYLSNENEVKRNDNQQSILNEILGNGNMKATPSAAPQQTQQPPMGMQNQLGQYQLQNAFPQQNSGFQSLLQNQVRLG